MDNTNNKEFWDKYVDYFDNKIREANSDSNASDKTASDKVYAEYFKLLSIGNEEKLLDFGCGFCRLYPIYKSQIGNSETDGYYGIDVSRRELELAESIHNELKIGQSLFEYDGMHIPFKDNFFDKISCWGVFDTCYQEEILQELMRVLKRGGRMLLTGKNNHYFEDDESAIVAEMNARKKGHPNYFTDVHNLTSQLLEHNVKIIDAYYFLRRGDFTRNQAVHEMPEIFYEYAFCLEKSEKYKYSEYQKFGDLFSMKFVK